MGSPDYCSPTAYGAPALDGLWENDGTARFVDAGPRAGITAVAANGLGVVCADFDRDGWTDVFVANDQDPDLLWRNRGDGTFADASLRTGVAFDRDGRAKAGMGVAAADLDGDGDQDLLVCNLRRETDSLFENRGSHFIDRTVAAGLGHRSRGFTRFGVGLVDLDLDGALDLFEANGRVMRRLPAFREGDDYAEPDLLIPGTTGLAFDPSRAQAPEAAPAAGRAAAFGDVDGDGAVDVLVVNRDAPAHLLINRAAPDAAWIGLDVRDASGAPALHALVELRAGEQAVHAEVRTAWSYLAASSHVLHVALTPGAPAEVQVRWPDGQSASFGPLEGGRVHRLAP